MSGLGGRWIQLRTPEIILLRRALAMYAKEYSVMRSMTSIAWEKEENQRYIEAADRLAERLLKETAAELPEGAQRELALHQS